MFQYGDNQNHYGGSFFDSDMSRAHVAGEKKLYTKEY